MPVSDLLTPEGVLGNKVAPYIPQTFGANFNTSLANYIFQSEAQVGPYFTDRTAFRERDDLIRKRFNVTDPFELLDTSDIDARYTNPTAAGRVAMLNEKQDLLDQHILQQRKINPSEWSRIRTKAEIEEATRDISRAVTYEDIYVQDRSSPFDAWVGGFLGGATGSVAMDPVNLMAMAATGGAGMTIRGLGLAATAPEILTAPTILQSMAMEGAVNVAVEAAQIPSRWRWQNEIGFKYGIGEAVADIATAGFGGAMFSGLIRGGGKALRAAGSRSMRVLDHIANNPKAPLSTRHRDAFNFNARIAHIDETIPVAGRTVTREDTRIHREALQETQDAFNAYREPNLSAASEHFNIATPRDIEDLNTFMARMEETQTVAPEKYIKVDEAALRVAELTGRISELDRVIRSRPMTDVINEIDPATGAILRDLDEKIKITKEQPKLQKLQQEREAIISNFREQETKPAAKKLLDRAQKEHTKATKELKKAKSQLAYRQKRLDSAERAVQRDLDAARKQYLEDRKLRLKEDVKPDFSKLKPYEFSDTAPEFDPVSSMKETIDESMDPKVADAIEADFQRLLDENPDLDVRVDEDSSMTLRDVLLEIQEEEDIFNAVRTCAIG